jgi:hypothetical protein
VVKAFKGGYVKEFQIDSTNLLTMAVDPSLEGADKWGVKDSETGRYIIEYHLASISIFHADLGDEIEAMISQDMVKDCARWKTSYNGWKNSVETLRKFARRRESRLIGFVQNYFDLTDAQMIEYGFSI